MTGIFAGGFIGYWTSSNANSEKTTLLQQQAASLQEQLHLLQENVGRLEITLAAVPTNISENSKDIENLRAAITQIQNQLLAFQQQISAQPTPSGFDQNIAVLQSEIDLLQNALSVVQQQVSALQSSSSPTVTYQNVTYVVGEGISLNQLFEQVKVSVVVVKGLLRQTDFFGRVYYSQIQGSGFVAAYSGQLVILTNNHVINGAINITATFTDGAIFHMSILGSSANTDFAVLSPATSISSYTPLEIMSSSTLKVGDPVIVVGTPYGLAGSMSNGIVSALNRTLSVSTDTEIYNVIQTTAPLNPGNSGGPVMNYAGQVVGIATAIVEESQGIGFAIPSDTILSELQKMLSA